MNLQLLSNSNSQSFDLRQGGPREKLRHSGAESLSDAELLALLIGTGAAKENAIEVASRILLESGGLHRLARHGQGSLAVMRGLGEAKASRIVAAFEIGVRAGDMRRERQRVLRFSCSRDIYSVYRNRLAGLTQEVFLVLGLNNKNQVETETLVAKGTVSECHVSPREVFRPLIMEACARMIALHNHPSGDPSPSPNDIALTRRLCEVGNLVGIPLLDHIVIGSGGYASLRDMGIIAPLPQ